jgi:hypothetical protein
MNNWKEQQRELTKRRNTCSVPKTFRCKVEIPNGDTSIMYLEFSGNTAYIAGPPRRRLVVPKGTKIEIIRAKDETPS